MQSTKSSVPHSIDPTPHTSAVYIITAILCTNYYTSIVVFLMSLVCRSLVLRKMTHEITAARGSRINSFYRKLQSKRYPLDPVQAYFGLDVEAFVFSKGMYLPYCSIPQTILTNECRLVLRFRVIPPQYRLAFCLLSPMGILCFFFPFPLSMLFSLL